jgi:hypothetical protein
MATSRVLLIAATLALVCLVGGADATWKQCPKGYKDCNPHKPGCETCITSDVNNCGDCGKKCASASYAHVQCYGGYCKYTCKPGYANCDTKWDNGCEVNTNSDAKNCGKCGNCCKQVKNADTKCQGGKCCEPVCKSGWGNCDGNIWSNGCEKDLSKDVYNCGKCGNKCPCTLKGGEPTCSAGKCGQQCKKGSKYDNKKKCCVPTHY